MFRLSVGSLWCFFAGLVSLKRNTSNEGAYYKNSVGERRNTSNEGVLLLPSLDFSGHSPVNNNFLKFQPSSNIHYAPDTTDSESLLCFTLL